MKSPACKFAKRLVVLVLPVFIMLACRSSEDQPGEPFLITPTGTHSAALSSPATATQPAFPEGSPTPAIPDLSGVWNDNGHLVVIVQNGYSLTSAYVEESVCDHADGTGATTLFRHDFTATIAQDGNTWKLSGDDFTVCAFGYDDTSFNGIYTTSMRAVVSEDFNSIIGDWYHLTEERWVERGLSLIRLFVDGAPMPTPTGLVLPTAAP